MRILPVFLNPRGGRALALRSPEGADAGAVLSYLRALHRVAYRNLNRGPDGFDAVTRDQEATMLEAAAASPAALMVAAFDGAAVAGIANVRADERPAVRHRGLVGLGVHPAWHGRGVGKGLMRVLIDQGPRAGITNMVLHVRAHNAPAIALYEGLGFRRVGMLEAAAVMDGEPLDELIYQRLLG